MENSHKKLSINTGLGITDIIMAVASLLAPALIFGNIISQTVFNTNIISIAYQTENLNGLFIVLGIVSLVLDITGLVKSKKAGISTTGHILGIVGAVLLIASPPYGGILAMVFYILAAIFTLKQKNVPIE